MTIQALVDDLYEGFADRIGAPLSAIARDLPRALRLARVSVPWSQVFPHEIVLGAPALFAESMSVPSALTRDAVLVHLLAVIDAHGIARVEDERIDAAPGVFAVLGHVRAERDRAMMRLFSRTPLADTDFRAADAMTIRAVRRERTLLKSAYPVDLDLYESTLVDKCCSSVMASVTLGRIAGLEPRRCRAIRATLESIALALHLYDDVVGWEVNLQRGGAWASCLMRGTSVPFDSGKHATRGAGARAALLGSGILERMLSRAHMHMRAARRRAIGLRARRLAAWAAAQESRLEVLVAAEADSAGHAVRAHALLAAGGASGPRRS
jgi:hypothetical protein